MRDFLAAVRDRVVVFDGGMGATLEQFDLSLENDYRLPGRCHEALVLNRPDVIQGVHESMVEAGAEAVETDTFQASRLKLDEWGLGEHTAEINRRAAEIAREAVGEERFVAGSIGPTGLPARVRGPDARPDLVPRARDVFEEQAHGLLEGGVDLVIIETAQDMLEVKAAIFGVRAAFATTGRDGPDPGLGLAAAPGRQDAARHRHLLRAGDARGAARRRHRPELLDRPRGHARRDPVPRRVLARCRSTASPTPASRTRGPTARRSSPSRPEPLAESSASSSSATA